MYEYVFQRKFLNDCMCINELNKYQYTYASYSVYTLISPTSRPQVSTEAKAVLVIGCDTGVGHTLALHLDQLVRAVS